MAAVILAITLHGTSCAKYCMFITSGENAAEKQSLWCSASGCCLLMALMTQLMIMPSMFDAGWLYTEKCLSKWGCVSLSFLHAPITLPALEPFWCFRVWPKYVKTSSSTHSPAALMLSKDAWDPGTMRMPFATCPNRWEAKSKHVVCQVPWGKKSIPKRINFLIKKSLKNETFGSSERLPLLSGVLPTNKNTYPPIRKPPPSEANFFLGCLFAIAFLFARTTSRFKIALT